MQRWTSPPLSSVRAFEAAARHLSFTRAAAELAVTQSAISHGVRDLEERFGVALFVRDGRPLALSAAGRHYLPFASEALERLRAGDHAIRAPRRRNGRVLTISVSPSFAAKWLAPRLGAFAQACPDIDLRVSATAAHVDFADDEIDIAVRHGDGRWPQLHCERLCEEELFPVCSPGFAGSRMLRTPADLASCTLIHHRDHAGWRDWLAAFDVAPDEAMQHGPMLDEMSLAIDAAVGGHGVALARTALAARDLRERRLVRPIPESRPAMFAYWIVCPRTLANEAKVKRLREWLIAEAESAGTGPQGS